MVAGIFVVAAADTERAALYQAGMEAFMTPLFAENRSATPPNSQEVADAVARVIALPAGERPLHTVVVLRTAYVGSVAT